MGRVQDSPCVEHARAVHNVAPCHYDQERVCYVSQAVL